MKCAIERAGLDLREVDRRAGWSPNYLSQLLRGTPDLKVVHVYTVLEVIGLTPEAFFGGLAKAGTGDLIRELTPWLRELAEAAVQDALEQREPEAGKPKRRRGGASSRQS